MASPAYLKEQLKKIKGLVASKEWEQVLSAAGRITDFYLSTPSGYQALVFKALAQLNLGHAAEAEELYKKAVELQPEQNLARQGLAKLYEKEERWEENAAALEELVVRVDAEQRRQLVDALLKTTEAHLPRESYLALLERFLPQGDLHESAPSEFSDLDAYMELLAFYSTTDTDTIAKETRVRRQRLQTVPKTAKETENDVKREVYASSRVPELLKLIQDHPDATSELRREIEERLLSRYLDHLSVMGSDESTRDLRESVRKDAEDISRGLVILKAENLPAWKVVLEWDDDAFSRSALTYEVWDRLSVFSDVFPESELATFLTLYQEMKRNKKGGKGKEEEEEEEDHNNEKEEKTQTQEHQYNSILTAIDHLINATSFSSWTLPYLLALDVLSLPIYLYSSVPSGDWRTLLDLCKAGKDALERKESETGKPFPLTRHVFDTYEVSALSRIDLVKNSSRIRVLINQLLGENATMSPFILSELRVAHARLSEEDEEWEKAKEDYESALKLVDWGEEVLTNPPEKTEQREIESLEVESEKLLFSKEELASSSLWCSLKARWDTLQNEPEVAEAFSESIEAWKATVSDTLPPLLVEERHTDVARALWRLGQLSERVGGPSPTSFYVKAIKISPVFAPAFTSLGEYYSDIGDDARATKCFQKALELDGSQFTAAHRLAQKYAQENEWSVVEAIAKRVLGRLNATRLKKHARDATVLWVYQALANSELEQQHFPQAIRHLSSLTTLSPDNISNWILLGMAYYRTGKYQSALKIYDHVLSVNPEEKHARMALGQLAKVIGEYKGAAEQFEIALEGQEEEREKDHIRLSLVATYVVYGTELLREGALAHAEERLYQGLVHSLVLLQKKPPPVLWKHLGDLFSSLGSLPQLDQEANVLSATESVLVYLEEHLQPDKGFIITSEVLRAAQPGPGPYLRAMGVLGYMMSVESRDGFMDLSALWYDVGVSLFRIRKDAESLGLGGVSFRELFLQGVKYVKKALSLDGHCARTWNALGVILFEENAKWAQHCFIRALEIDPRSHVAWSNLGLFYLEHDEEEMAEEALMRSHVLVPEHGPVWGGLYELGKRKSRVEAEKCRLEAEKSPRSEKTEDDARGDNATQHLDIEKEPFKIIEHAFGVTTDQPEIDLCYAKEAFLRFQQRSEPLWDVRSEEQVASELSDARFALQRYLQRYPDCPTALNLFSLVLECFKEYELALEAAEHAVAILEEEYEVDSSAETEEHYTLVQVNAGRLRLFIGRYEEAVESFEAAETLVEDDIQDEMRRRRGNVIPLLSSSSRSSAGSLKIENAIRVITEALLGQALAHFHLGEADKAIEILEEGLEELEILEGSLTDSLSVTLSKFYWAEKDEDRALSALLDARSDATRVPKMRYMVLRSLAVLTNDRAILLTQKNIDAVDPAFKYDVDVTELYYYEQLLRGDFEGAMTVFTSRVYAHPWKITPRRRFIKALLYDLPELKMCTGEENIEEEKRDITIPFPNVLMMDRIHRKKAQYNMENEIVRSRRRVAQGLSAVNVGDAERALEEFQGALVLFPWGGRGRQAIETVRSVMS